ncbi:hypothetical protein ACFYU5_01080 [Nocardia aobensis]|jgi:hypothetical protein|uniref:Uncharacterized protein n=3 Tax=Nocardia TaxID=1817 RepID=A0A231H524_9NOCA|nr:MULTISPECIES: hypothetical protein [Nocardia]MDR7169914.1 hypothetical protein [Nocardia kruczakiae]NKY46444.1 hypothetical protein [Nocardia cerradoensis]OXR43892.1 hypothetical protein B7C42_04131 [Nocardia cerradoensis]
MNAFIALIDSNSAGTVNSSSVFTNIMNLFVTGSAGSATQGGGIFN